MCRDVLARKGPTPTPPILMQCAQCVLVLEGNATTSNITINIV